jgi:hypothetical protein
LFSGEATLHQKLGEQDSWLKPKLLAWKLELNRRTPLDLCRSVVAGDRTSRVATLLLSIAFLAGTVAAAFDRSLEPFLIDVDHSPWPAVGRREVVTSCLFLVLAGYGLNPWTLINHGCHQVPDLINPR